MIKPAASCLMGPCPGRIVTLVARQPSPEFKSWLSHHLAPRTLCLCFLLWEVRAPSSCL